MISILDTFGSILAQDSENLNFLPDFSSEKLRGNTGGGRVLREFLGLPSSLQKFLEYCSVGQGDRRSTFGGPSRRHLIIRRILKCQPVIIVKENRRQRAVALKWAVKTVAVSAKPKPPNVRRRRATGAFLPPCTPSLAKGRSQNLWKILIKFGSFIAASAR